MCKLKQARIQKMREKKNEDKSSKIACTNKKLAITWNIAFVLEFLLCQ